MTTIDQEMTAVTLPINADPTARIVTITPDMAAKLLARNNRNRHISPSNYATIVRAIRNGEWQLNGEGIKIDVFGNILDGQHRLLAVLETGISIRTWLFEGLDPETQDSMDSGRVRGLNDTLQIRGEKNSGALAAAIRKIALYKRYGLRQAAVGSNPVTKHEMLAFFEEHRDIADLLTPAKRVAVAAKLPSSLGCLLMYAFSEIDADEAQYFFEHLATGAGLPQGSPIGVLREALRRIYDSRGASNQVHLAALVIKAWNKYRDGESITLLKFTPGGANPEQFPVPR